MDEICNNYKNITLFIFSYFPAIKPLKMDIHDLSTLLT